LLATKLVSRWQATNTYRPTLIMRAISGKPSESAKPASEMVDCGRPFAVEGLTTSRLAEP
jgi:hypothetical protein